VTDDYSDAGEILLEVPAYEAACIKVDPDGPDPGMIAWQPNQVEVTDLMEGAGELTLEVTLTRRNAFGPLHHTPFTSTTGPGHFLSTGNMFTMNYMLYPVGIMESPRLLIYK